MQVVHVTAYKTFLHSQPPALYREDNQSILIETSGYLTTSFSQNQHDYTF